MGRQSQQQVNKMKTRNWNWLNGIKCYDETETQYQFRRIKNFWLQIKKQYWNLINK